MSVKTAVKRLVASTFGWRVLAAAARKPGVVVLTYHRIGRPSDPIPGLDASLFREHMRWLREHCLPITPDELPSCARAPRRARPYVLVTLDDGYRGYHDHAYPVLKELGIPALVFLATRFMDEPVLLWADRLYLAMQATRRKAVRVPWSAEPLSLRDARDRAAALRLCKAHLKAVSETQKETELEGLIAALDVSASRLTVDRQMMSWDEVRATVDLTGFGGHSHTHPILSRVTPSRMDDEIRRCRERIAEETGTAPRFFAYPNGRPGDFTAETKRLVRGHGFEIAFTTVEDVAGPHTDWTEVPRVPAGGSVPEFAWQVSTIWRRWSARRGEARTAPVPL